MKVYIKTYGCTLNRADTDIMKGILLSKGHEIVSEREADVVILNTCTVKETTENKIMSKIKAIDKPLVVAGCMSINEKRIRKQRKDLVIIGTGALNKIEKAIEDAKNNRYNSYFSFSRKDELERIYTAPILRIPIEDGCVNNCSYCETKFARPGLRSLEIKTIGKWIREGVKRGAKEIELTGMDTGAYGLDLKTNLIEMLKAVLEEQGDFYIRLGMINPQHAKRMLKELIEIYKHKKMFKFLHIPVQSGSNKILRLMNRGHSKEDYIDIVRAFRKEIPEITIATDIIVGFPGEEQEDFEQSLELIEKTEPDITNISRFSVREHARAKLMKKHPTEILKQRSREMSKLVREISEKRNKQYIGKEVEIIILEKGKKGLKGRSMNYKQVVVEDAKIGEKIKVKIKDADRGTLYGYRIK